MAAQNREKWDDGGEPPLDPAAERVRRKLARLLLGSLGVMMLGLIAVFAAIVYRVAGAGGEAAPALRERADIPLEAAITLPAGARIEAAALDGDQALLTIAHADGRQGLVVIDLATGRILARFDVGR